MAKLVAVPMNVDYYGVVSHSTDMNILKMAQDIFLTQLKSIDKITVDDKRPDISRPLASAPSITNENHIAFYAEIMENAIGSASVEWNCRFNAVSTDGTIYSKSERYDSYYKILTGAKAAIEDVLNQIPATTELTHHASPSFSPSNSPHSQMKAESLAGTWGGEPYTDKIVLLRGGRGFVIFKNGASMNITVKVLSTDNKGNVSEVEVAQVGKPNASFYPALPREIALASAADAKPITWNFQVNADGTLSGTKTTLIASDESPTGAEEGKEPSTWIKK